MKRALLSLLVPVVLASAAGPASAQAPSSPPPSPPPAPTPTPVPCTTIARIAILDTTAVGLPPDAAKAVTAEVTRRAAALGYRPLPSDAVQRAAVDHKAEQPGASAETLATLARFLGAQRVVTARIEALSPASSRVQLFVVGADGGRWTASRDVAPAEIAATAADLVRSALPPPMPVDCVAAPATGMVAATKAPAPTAAPASVPSTPAVPLGPRLALRSDAAFGVSRGSFTNVLLGARLDMRFTRTVAVGAYLGYANLKGRDGSAHDGVRETVTRAHNVLAYAQIERRLLVTGRPVAIPLRFATGYLPRNGAVLRVAAGLAFEIAPGVELGADLIAPTFWVTRSESLVSLDVGLELSFAL